MRMHVVGQAQLPSAHGVWAELLLSASGAVLCHLFIWVFCKLYFSTKGNHLFSAENLIKFYQVPTKT